MQKLHSEHSPNLELGPHRGHCKVHLDGAREANTETCDILLDSESGPNTLFGGLVLAKLCWPHWAILTSG